MKAAAARETEFGYHVVAALKRTTVTRHICTVAIHSFAPQVMWGAD